jgi:hypothetical protein
MKTMGCIQLLFRNFAASAVLAAAALADTQDDIRDIRGPKALPVWSWVVTALVAAVLITSAYAAYAIRRRRRSTVSRHLTLAEQTLERLEGARRLMQSDMARDFAITTSEVIRYYIERRFDVRVTQRTTEEFLQTILQGTNGALSRHRALLAHFLEQCDLVKFAGASLANADLEALFESARSFVLKTREPALA